MEIKDYETLLKRAYQTAPIGLCFFDTELRYRHINEWLASINGLTVEEHLGRTIDEVIPDVSAEIESILRRVMETGEPILNGVVEAETPALPNQKRFFQHSYHAVTSDEGITVGVNCIVQDITERKRAEENLSKNQERLTLAMDVTSEGLWDWNIATGYMYYSPQWCAALGFDPSEVEPRGRFWASLVHPDDMPHFTEVLNAHFEGKTKTYECEVRLRTKSGEYRWNLDRGKVVAWDDDGKPLRMVGVDVDITERRQAEEAVRESEERYLTLSEASFEGIVIHDQGTVIDVNTRFQEMFGYSLEELKELKPFICVAPEYRENVRQIVAKELVGPYEAVGLRKDSSTFPMELQARHMLYRGRRVRVVACQNITERKRAEEALRFIGDRTDSSTGKEFFSSLVEHLATALNTRFAFVSEVVDSKAHKVRLLAYWMGSELGSNFEYDIRDSPCEHVVNKKLAFFSNGIQALFPDDIWLRDNEIQSYLAIPLFDPSGHPIGHFGVADIVSMEKSGLSELVLRAFAARASTEIVRNRAEQTLRQSEANLARAQEIAKIGNWHWDIAANKISWSDQYYHIVGLDKEEFAANYNASLRCIHPGDLELFKKTTARVLREKTSWSIEYRIVRPDNDIRVIHELGEISVDADGNAVSLFGTAQDITERKEAEENLRQSQFAVEHSSNPIYWVRKDGRIIYANEAACQSLGHTRDELLSMSVTQIDPDFPEGFWPGHWQDMKREKRSTFETHHRRKDGGVFPVQITTNYLEYNSQEFIWAYVTDITERKRAEEALIAQAETERLLRRELDHRVRNNLASLISLIDMSRSGSDSTDGFAESIKGRVQTIARVHAALSHNKWHAIELRSLLNTLLDTSLEGHIKLDGPSVIIPPEQAQAIGLIAHELVTNSRKHGALGNPNGCVEVAWETHRDESGTRQVLIHWLETGGPPIEAEPKPGIGMDLIRGLVKSELQGRVDFRFPSHGADHTIAIPLTAGSAAHSEVMADATRVDVLSFKKSAHPTPDR